MTWLFFFFKQKTAYEMRISDWSSDVCSSDLGGIDQTIAVRSGQPLRQDSFGCRDRDVDRDAADFLDGVRLGLGDFLHRLLLLACKGGLDQIGRASCRERVCQYV